MPPEAAAPSPSPLREAVRQPLLGQQEVQNSQPKLNPQQRVLQMWAEGMGMGTPAFVSREDWTKRIMLTQQ